MRYRKMLAVATALGALTATTAEGCDKSKEEAYKDGTLRRTVMVNIGADSASFGMAGTWEVTGGNYRSGKFGPTRGGHFDKTIEFVQGKDFGISITATSSPDAKFNIISCRVLESSTARQIKPQRQGNKAVTCEATSDDVFRR
jgi:hypothetical protein